MRIENEEGNSKMDAGGRGQRKGGAEPLLSSIAYLLFIIRMEG